MPGAAPAGARRRIPGLSRASWTVPEGSWLPSSRFSSDAIAQELKRELGSQLPSGTVQLALDNPGIRLLAPAGAAPGITVDNLAYDARSGRLTAYVSAQAGAAETEPLRVTGRVYRMIELPVLTRQVAPGEAIADRDIDIIAVR